MRFDPCDAGRECRGPNASEAPGEQDSGLACGDRAASLTKPSREGIPPAIGNANSAAHAFLTKIFDAFWTDFVR